MIYYLNVVSVFIPCQIERPETKILTRRFYFNFSFFHEGLKKEEKCIYKRIQTTIDAGQCNSSQSYH